MTSPLKSNNSVAITLEKGKQFLIFNPVPKNIQDITKALHQEGMYITYYTLDKHSHKETMGFSDKNLDSKIVKLMLRNNNSLLTSFKIANALNQFSYVNDHVLAKQACDVVGEYYTHINEVALDSFKLEHVGFLIALKKISDNKATSNDFRTALDTITSINTENFSSCERTNEYFAFELQQLIKPIEAAKKHFESLEKLKLEKANWKSLFWELHNTPKGEVLCSQNKVKTIDPQALKAIASLPDECIECVLNTINPAFKNIDSQYYSGRYIQQQQHKIEAQQNNTAPSGAFLT